MKRTLYLSVIIFLFLLTGCGDSPDTPKNTSPVSNFEYIENEEGDITITKYVGAEYNVVIPSKIEGKRVTQLGIRAFSGNQTIVSVEIPDSTNLIFPSIFEGCSSLTKVSLPHNLKEISGKMFSNCKNLSEITLPSTLTSIGKEAFANCTSLKHINIPKSLTIWGESAFMFSGLETIDLEEGLEMIGKNAFARVTM